MFFVNFIAFLQPLGLFGVISSLQLYSTNAGALDSGRVQERYEKEGKERERGMWGKGREESGGR